MDFPKSVAGVGLVDGKFVDEDQVNGTPGSLIPAQWGNDVTEEILNVVREVGDEPAEATKNQLVGAIWKMFRSGTASATEALRGVLRVGTQEEVDAGELDDVVVTPKKLRMGFAASFGQNGYIALPVWLAGVILQWGRVTAPASLANSTYTDIAFPTAFPNACYAAQAIPQGAGNSSAGGIPSCGFFGAPTQTGVTVSLDMLNYTTINQPIQVGWWALGR